MRRLARVEDVAAYGAMAVTFVMMCLTTADAAGRYLLNRPIPWAYEITENYLMVAAVFLAAARAYRRGNFIQVTFLYDRLPYGLQAVVRLLVQGLSVVLAALFVVAMVVQVRDKLTTDVPPGTLATGPSYVVVSAGLLLLALALGLDLVTRRSSFFSGDEPRV